MEPNYDKLENLIEDFNEKSSMGVPYGLILVVLLMIAKGFGASIPWIWVFSPVWIPIAGILVTFGIAVIFGLLAFIFVVVFEIFDN